MEISVLSLQDLDELQLSHLWHLNVRMTSAVTKENIRTAEKLRFVIVTFWASSDCNKLELDELESVIKTRAGEQSVWESNLQPGHCVRWWTRSIHRNHLLMEE